MDKINAGGHTWSVDAVPNECPQCHHAIDPRPLGGVIRKAAPMGQAIVEAVYQCPRQDCLRVFIARYNGQYSTGSADYHLRLRATTPYTPRSPEHSPEVSAVSAQFVAIYGEAAAAEVWGLKEIAGCGYRKALEFLVKDYCIAQQPDQAETIKAKFLANVIRDHLDDAVIKACAERAAWLGNDESHYTRRWTELDVSNLKELIALTESWITTAERTKAYLARLN